MDAFTPPAEYAFAPELLGPVPRPIPALVRQGRFAQTQRRLTHGFLGIGALLVALDYLPAAQVWAKFVPLLAHLSSIGNVSLGLGAWFILAAWLRLGPYCYIRRGIPLVARVVALEVAQQRIVKGWRYFAVTAVVEYRDPETGELRSRELKSPEFLADAEDDYTTTFQIGDCVTAVYLPGAYPQSLQLYGFLNLVPGLGCVRCRSFWSRDRILWATRLAGFLIIALWNAYALNSCAPFCDFRNVLFPAATLGVVLAVPFFFWILPRGNGVWRWAVRPTFSLLFGGATALGCCVAANAWLDTSPAELKPAEIHGVKVVTLGWLWRAYVVEYSLPRVNERQQYSTSPETAAAFMRVKIATAEVHAGRFHWPWVKRLRP